MNATEIAQLVAKEQRDEVSRFVYFLFSITTVSIGYAITRTQGIHPSCWLIVWGLSVVAMCCSLIFGVFYIHQNNQALGHGVAALSLSESIEKTFKKSHENLKLEIKKIQKIVINPSTFPEQRDIFVVKQLEKNSTESNMGFEEYIDSLSPEKLKDILAKLLYQAFGESSEIEVLIKACSTSVKASKSLMRQLGSITIGYLLFLIWHIGTLFP